MWLPLACGVNTFYTVVGVVSTRIIKWNIYFHLKVNIKVCTMNSDMAVLSIFYFIGLFGVSEVLGVQSHQYV